jgi:hypothetical protein
LTGETGPQGLQGIQGLTGPQGPAGSSEYVSAYATADQTNVTGTGGQYTLEWNAIDFSQGTVITQPTSSQFTTSVTGHYRVALTMMFKDINDNNSNAYVRLFVGATEYVLFAGNIYQPARPWDYYLITPQVYVNVTQNDQIYITVSVNGEASNRIDIGSGKAQCKITIAKL